MASTTSYTVRELTLVVPIAVFVNIKSNLAELASKIEDQFRSLFDLDSEERIRVSIEMASAKGSSATKSTEVTPTAPIPERIWGRDSTFRLFLSHLAKHKAEVSKVKQCLTAFWGIASFVAHDDIEPTRAWQDEIESALRSMDAFAALLVDGFKTSNWCDQEVGFAVARGVPVVPVRLGQDPYGFIGRIQGTVGHLDKP